MKMFLAILCLCAVHASAQLVPKLTVTVTLPSLAEARAERTRQTNALAQVKSEIDPLDERPRLSISPENGRAMVVTTTLYAGKPMLLAAQEFIRTNNWPAGTIVRIERHLCPHTNAVPAGWIGCNNDPRAENTRIVLKP